MVLNAEKLSLNLSGRKDSVFRDLSFELSEGSTGFVSGKSGSGKTLLGLSLCGYLPHWVGEFELCGSLTFLGSPLVQGETGYHAGIVLENPYAQISGIKQTVFGELAFPLECRGIRPLVIFNAVGRIADDFGVSKFLGRNIKTLSGGELQRVVVAAALISGPRFIFLDRLMTEIDSDFRKRLLWIISSVARESNGAALIAEDPWLLPDYRFTTTVPLGAKETFDPERIPPLANTTPGGELLGVDSLSFGYDGGPAVLEDVSFSLSAGELKRISGPNGAGKTTLAKILAGIIEPSSGEIVIDRRPYRTMEQWEKMSHTGLALQHPELHFCRRTVREELALGEKWGNEINGLAGVLGLEPLLERHPLELRQAEKKRLGIALAYGERRNVIILDEPSQYQDNDGFGKIMTALNFMLEKGKGVLLITHDPRFDTFIHNTGAIRLSRANNG